MPLPTYIPWQPEVLDERRIRAREVRRQPVGLVAVGMAIGITADRYLDIPPLAGWIASLLLVVAWWKLLRHRRGGTIALVLALAALTSAWHHLKWNYFSVDHLVRHAEYDTQPCAIEVIALASPTRALAPEPSPYRAIPGTEESRIQVECVRVRNGETWQPTTGRALLTVDGVVDGINRGDRLKVFAQFARPSPAANAGEFDYALHLRAERQLVVLLTRSPESVTVLERGNWWSPFRHIDRLRGSWSDQLWQQLPQRKAAMASALLIGAEGAMPREDTIAFRTTGTTHVLVVSGLHTGIVIGMLYIAVRFGWLANRWGALLAIALAIGFAILTGLNPPVVRAAVLVVLAALATLLARRVLAYNSLAVALVVVLFMNPAELFRTGTQLSFLCVVSLVAFGEWILARPRRDPIKQLVEAADPSWWRWGRGTARYVWHITFASGCVWLASLPLIMHAYNIVTPIAVVISPLLFLLLSVALASGFAMLILGLVSSSMASLVAPLTAWCIGSLDELVALSNSVPWGHAWTFGPATWWVVGGYAIAGGLWQLAPHLLSRLRWLRWLAIWVLAGCVPFFAATFLKPTPLVCHIIDVGHGACVAIETPEGKLLLYDAGSLGSPHSATETISNFLWARGHRRIDAIVLSHADVDHFDAVPGLLDRFEVAAVFISPHMFSAIDSLELAPAPAALQKLLAERGIPVSVIELGDRLTIDSVTMAEVLHPGFLDVAGGDNSRSLVLGVESAGRRVLLPGDLESPGIEAVMADEPYDCDVLLAPHHGSARSDPPGFAEWSTPEWVVISGSRDLGRDVVTASYQARGATVFDTSVAGCVTFELHADDVSVTTYRER